MERVKKISKYVVNGLNMINALIVALSGVWNWNIDNISKTIIAITGVISVYLVSGKIFETNVDEICSQNAEMPDYDDEVE